MIKKDLSRNTIKYIAVITMILDHTALFFLDTSAPLGFVFRFFGRLTAPVMSYFLAEGYKHTKSKEKYALRLFSFALISQPFYAISFYNDIFISELNMIATLFLSFCILFALEQNIKLPLKIGITAVITGLTAFCDWGVICPVWVLIFYFTKNRKQTLILYFITSLLYITFGFVTSIKNGEAFTSNLWFFGIFLFPLVVSFYKGRNGKKTAFGKWFFYIVYPLHLIVLRIIFNLLNL